jgi:hypothetical protein
MYLEFRGSDFLPRLMLQEAGIMEFLARHRHTHIVSYYGRLLSVAASSALS